MTEGNIALRGNESSGEIKFNKEGSFLRNVKIISKFDPIFIHKILASLC